MKGYKFKDIPRQLLGIFIVFITTICLIGSYSIIDKLGITERIAKPITIQQTIDNGDSYNQIVMDAKDVFESRDIQSVAILVSKKGIDVNIKQYLYYKATYWLYPSIVDVSDDVNILSDKRYDAYIVILEDNDVDSFLKKLNAERLSLNVEYLSNNAFIISNNNVSTN